MPTLLAIPGVTSTRVAALTGGSSTTHNIQSQCMDTCTFTPQRTWTYILMSQTLPRRRSLQRYYQSTSTASGHRCKTRMNKHRPITRERHIEVTREKAARKRECSTDQLGTARTRC